MIFMQLYLLFLPSSLIYLLILVIPFSIIMLVYLYFFSQELSIIYLDFSPNEVRDDSLYKFAYSVSLISIPSMLVSIAINIMFLTNSENLIVGSFFSLVWSFIPFIIYMSGIYYLMRFISESKFGLLKIVELICLSVISIFRSKFGLEIIEEIKADMKNLDS